MATATATKKPASQYGQFVYLVSRKTGIDTQVLLAWLLAEHGKSGNPLNIINPSTKRPYDYGSPDAAANATAQLLLTPRYRPIITAAQSGDVGAQIGAITASQWDSCHYRGLNKDGSCATHPPGTLLRGLYKDLTGIDVTLGKTTSTTAPSGVSVTQTTPGPKLTSSLTGWVGDLTSWAEGAGLRVLAYLLLTVVAIALFVLGLEKTLGVQLPRAANPVRPGAAEDIPF